MKTYLKTKDFFLSKEPFDLLFDEEQDLLVTHPQPKELEKYYASHRYISHSDQASSLLEKIYLWIRRFNNLSKLKLVEKYLNENQTLLDVGAGTGDFLLYAKKKDWKVKGIEPNEKARKLAAEKGVVLHEKTKDLKEKSFQIITLWHVLEHLPNLRANIKELANLLDKNGTLLIAVPNFKSFDAQYYGSHWAAYDVPRHLWHFSRTAIKQLFSEYDMQLIKTKPMWFDAFYVSLLSEAYKTGKKNWIKALSIGAYSNLRGILSKEYSSHIYILKKSI